jgi:hypothetical protein
LLNPASRGSDSASRGSRGSDSASRGSSIPESELQSHGQGPIARPGSNHTARVQSHGQGPIARPGSNRTARVQSHGQGPVARPGSSRTGCQEDHGKYIYILSGTPPRQEVFNRTMHSSKKKCCAWPHLLPAHRQVFMNSAFSCTCPLLPVRPYAIEWSKAERSPMCEERSVQTSPRGMEVMTGVVAAVHGLHTNSGARVVMPCATLLDVSSWVRPALSGVWSAQSHHH